MELQYFGTVETAEGLARGMLCIDGDRPAEYMFQWSYDGTPPPAPGRGIKAIAAWEDGVLKLKAAWIYRTNPESGALYLPRGSELTAEEQQAAREIRAELTRTPTGGLAGQWTGPGNTTGALTFDLPPRERRVSAQQCRSWSGF